VQIVVSKFICLLQVGAIYICLQYSHDDVIGQSNTQELKLQYSCIGSCIYATADTWILYFKFRQQWILGYI